jgi:hypothetical protein
VIDGNRAVFVVDKDRGDAGAVYIVGGGRAVAGGEDVEVVVVLDVGSRIQLSGSAEFARLLLLP